ncbi:MAG: EAL domain-containing protein [Burkholderiales bacterium]
MSEERNDAAARRGSSEQANILVVDDRPANLLVFRTMLEQLGQNIVTATSGHEALKRLLERDFAVILLDVNMGGMDGFETAEYIRGIHRTAHTPIIFLTAYPEAMQPARGYALGAVDCIITPVIPEILRAKVQVFVDLYLLKSRAHLVEAQRATQGMIEALPNPIFFTDSEGCYRGVNRAWESLFGFDRTSVVGRKANELFPGKTDLAAFSEPAAATQVLQAETHPFEASIPGADGMFHDVLCYRASYATPDGELGGLIGTIVDISERKRAEKRQAMEHAVTRVLAEASDLTAAITKIIEMICSTMGWDYGARWAWRADDRRLHRRETWGIDTPSIREFDRATGRHGVEPYPPAKGLMRRAFATRKPVWISDLAKDASFKRENMAKRAGLQAGFAFPLMRGEEAIGVLEFFHRDVREPDPLLVNIADALGCEIGQYIVRMQAEEAVKFMAMHDALTQLPNRAAFNERLARAISLAQRHKRALAVLFIDLDRFKLINDTLGHEAGDNVLREAAARLTDNLRGGDTVARLGGDEFIILLEDVPDPVYVGSVSQKLIHALSAPFTIGEREYRVTASIGVSVYPADGDDPETLLKHADIAMYRAKETGRNAFEFYSERISAGSLERLSLESGLRRAVERDEFRLHFQPQIEACTGRIVGMEALVRWQHPEMGLLLPARFIRIAEETGLIVPLGEWVLHTACKAHQEWQRMRIPLSRIAVNLSPRQFLHAGLVKDTLRALESTGCSGRFIEMEITESMVMHDPAGAVATMAELKDAGVRIGMDDFGTGYSSLAHLKRFPIDSIKVDRSFIADVPNDAGNVAITQAIIAMARTLHLTVIAEGVETPAQFNFLRSRGCDEVQGYYFSPPLPFDEATALLVQSTTQPTSAVPLPSDA